MFKKLIEMIKEALREMVSYKGVNETIKDQDIYTISEAMSSAIEKWKQLYKDEAPWLNEKEGVYSLGIAGTICSELAMYVLNELDSHVVTPGMPEENTKHDESQQQKEPSTRAEYLDDLYHKHLLNKLDDVVEKAMALGGVVIKPYVNNNKIYYDFCYQGEFYPIAFDDDGNITDIAFLDQFIAEDQKYSKIERQTFSAETQTILIQNKAYKCKYNPNAEENELGTEIPLTMIDKWASVEPEVTIPDVEKPLYGYYKVPLANNIDLKSPLGISVFSKATRIIERTDRQFSRLDWEYEGGQIAIDVDPTALPEESYYGQVSTPDALKNRIYRKIDLGSDETYNAFVPSLRDTNYIQGLNKYLSRIEDITCLARGTLSEVQMDARTATEIKALARRTFNTVHKHQEALQSALQNVIYASNVLVNIYNPVLNIPDGEYVLNTEWSDSILVDIYTELAQRLQLVDSGILSKAEVRSWYTGEDMETAKAAIAEMQQESLQNMANDLFNTKPEATLEKE